MPNESKRFPVLSDGEIEILRPYGDEVTYQPDEPLWEPGNVDVCFFVVLSGGITCRNSIGDTSVLVRHSVGNFSGGIDTLNGRPAPVGGFADNVTNVLQISADSLREVVRVEQNLGGKILAALISRSELLLDAGTHGLMLIGSPLDPHTTAIRTFLGRNRVVHRWMQAEEEQTAEIMRAFGLTAADTPIILLGNQRIIHPTIDDLGSRLGVRTDTDHTNYDLVIVGAGPAGLAAAVYGASEGLSTLILDRAGPGGQASWSSRIENYMGFPEGLSGSDLASRGLVQAQKFGAKLSVPADVLEIKCLQSGQQIHLATGESIDARAVILASGANYQKLDIPGYSRFETCGIYYAATTFESQYCTEVEVAVVGAGNSAGQAAVFLSQTAKKVTLIVRGDRLNKSMSDYLSYRVEQIRNIDVLLNTEVTELHGEDKL
jgi:thioredoxin reductase (NADPH)